MTKADRLDARYALAYRAEYSSRYHRRRASFLNKVDSLCNLTVMMMGTGAFVSLVSAGPVLLAMSAALIVTAISTCQIVLSIGQSGWRHAEWMRRWDRLANDIRSSPSPTLEQLQEWESIRADIEGECVVELEALAVACENDARSYLGTTEGIRRVSRFQRAFIQLGTFQREFPFVQSATALPPKAPVEPT